MREHAAELKRAARQGRDDAVDEAAVLAKIAELPDADRAMAERLHALVKATAPGLGSRLWYGMPAYTSQGTVVCFFQPAGKFKTRYSTLGFSDKAQLDDGDMWPTSFALMAWTPATESHIAELVKKALR